MTLTGQILIEASAGTGKTFATATIYVRALIGINTLAGRAFTPKELLVCTFTDDAAEELRTRIFTRISDTIQLIHSSDPSTALEIELLAEVGALAFDAAKYDSAESLALARLESALISMDESAIFTIHGFANRVLSEFAFETRAPFDYELLTSSADIRLIAAADFWRSKILTLDATVQRHAVKFLKDPYQLARNYLAPNSHTVIEYGDVQTAADAVAIADANSGLQDALRAAMDTIGGPGALANELLGMGLAGNIYRKAGLEDKLIALYGNLAAGGSIDEKALLLLSPEKFEASLNKTSRSEFDDISICWDLRRFFAGYRTIEWDSVERYLLQSSNEYMYQKIEAEKRVGNNLDFDDLLSLLEAALHSETGDQLAATLAAKYPIACVDEFQDTDPIQYSIFRKIYSHANAVALLMIGDPKQAIYGFRGGDVFTYLAARSSATAQYTLDTNYRSHANAVEAVNLTFSGIDLTRGCSQHDMPYHPVQAWTGMKSTFEIQNVVQPGMSYVTFAESAKNAASAEYWLADMAANHISKLLAGGVEGSATINGAGIEPNDIAILVSTHLQAGKVSEALQRLGIDAVSKSRMSVFTTQTAKDIASIIAAMLHPNLEEPIKTALCCQTMAMAQQDLDDIYSNEAQWESLVGVFAEAKAIALTKGIAAGLQQIWRTFGVGKKLGATRIAERAITNWRHTIELLQVREQEVAGMTDLYQYLAQQITKPSGTDAEELRLESEDNLVQIVTLHKSKGLEYPVVFLPFVSLPVKLHDNTYHIEDGDRVTKVVDVSGSSDVAKAELELSAEQLRLFYVGITRAKYSTIVYSLPIQTTNRKDSLGIAASPLAYVFDATEAADIHSRMRSLAFPGSGIKFVENPDIEGVPYSAQQTHSADDLSARVFTGSIDRSWRVASYSSISKSGSNDYIIDQSLDVKIGEQVDAESDTLNEPTSDSIECTFPKGSVAGQCLHDILEGQVNDSEQGLGENVALQLQRYGFDEVHQAPVTEWINRCMSQPMAGGTFTLASLTQKECKAEMQFHLGTGKVSCKAVNRILRKHPLHKRDLDFIDFTGLLTGFIDLTVIKDKVFIVDYKSNFLPDYSHASLSGSISDHRYYLQYLIYTVAVHRLLKLTWPGYSYEAFGGVEYAFLRGMTGQPGTGIWSERPDLALIEELDSLLTADPEVIA
jgi:exodeoxyribonuclease V beta subunit